MDVCLVVYIVPCYLILRSCCCRPADGEHQSVVKRFLQQFVNSPTLFVVREVSYPFGTTVVLARVRVFRLQELAITKYYY